MSWLAVPALRRCPRLVKSSNLTSSFLDMFVCSYGVREKNKCSSFFLTFAALMVIHFWLSRREESFLWNGYSPLSGGNGTLTKTPSREWSGMCSKEPKMLCDEQRMGFGAAPYRQDFVEFMILKKMGQNSIYF